MTNELQTFFSSASKAKKDKADSPGSVFLKNLEEGLHTSNPFLTTSTKQTEVISEEVVPEIIEPIEELSLVERAAAAMGTASNVIAPEAPILNYSGDIKALNDRFKFVEGWLSKIASTGPGSGEVNFRWLDDIDRTSIGNTDQILRYNPTSKKFFFGQLSGDQGPVKSILFDANGASVTKIPGMISWNKFEDCLDITQSDGTTLQTGQELYIRVDNHTATTLTNGTFVQFAGVSITDEVPLATPYIANGLTPPLYTIGVVTENILPNTIGRVTTFGKVRDLDTTGTSVGETWVIGDLLWAHPTIAGALTKVQPSNPNIAISVAAVLRVHATLGILLVRPTIFPRLANAAAKDTIDQPLIAINTAQKVLFRNTISLDGFVKNADNATFIAQRNGLYYVRAQLHLSSTNASTANLYVWGRLNNVDIPNSTIRTSISINGGNVVLNWQRTISLVTNDAITIMMGGDTIALHLDAGIVGAFYPASSANIAINQVDL